MPAITGLIILVSCLQVPQRTSGDYSITGIVTNSANGAPIKQALVQLESPVGEPPPPVFTDANGGFRFSGLQAGTWRVQARKPGYNQPSEDVTFSLGPSREDVSVRMDPLAVIAGRVLDSYGEPISNVMVHALQSRLEKGRRRLSVRRWANSNDLGEYRLWDLDPGRYYVKVAGRYAPTRHYIGEIGPAQSDESFAPIYYGGGQSAASATPITVAAGGQTQADFNLELQPGRNIIGAIINAAPYRPVQVELFRGEEDAGTAPATVNIADGRFRIPDVVDGAYTLRVTQGEGVDRTRAVERIEVSGRDVTGLLVRLAPGITVTGRLRIDGVAPNRRAYGSISLEPLDTHARSYERGPSARPDQDGKFDVTNVLPGRYRVEVMTFFGYAASITSGDRDLLRGGELRIDPMDTPPPLEIVVRSDGGEVTGTVLIAGRPAAETRVLLVPTSEPWREIKETRAARDGRYSFTMVPPGEYRVQARKGKAQPGEDEAGTAEALSTAGERLQVVANGKHKLDITSLSEATR